MRNKFSRVIAMVLTAAMAINMLPMPAIATDFDTVSDISTQVYTTDSVDNDDNVDELVEEEATEEVVEETTEEVVEETTEEVAEETTEEVVEETTEEVVEETTEEVVEETTEEVVEETTEDKDDDEDDDDEDEDDDEDDDEDEDENSAVVLTDDEDVATIASVSEADMAAALEKAKTYIDAITINNSSNDPATVVSNYGTHFTWDNEKREKDKKYLYDWSYYNGVVFEGLEYVYEVLGDTTYAEYVVEYMSTMITEKGTWATCANNSAKEAAGYVDYHGADCYKTASLLIDLYKITGDSRYKTMADTLYTDLIEAAGTKLLANAGNNYYHTWSSTQTYNLWLDGLYMVLPFMAEYAAYTGDEDMLTEIVSRMQWVSDYMYNESTGLFYHAAESSSKNSGTYWLRSIGWYAAAIADVMDHMSGDNLEAMKAQLVKLVDGMKAVQNTSNGMWLNNMAASQSSTNPYETSGTALVCYAVIKAVNEGWLDASYADMAELAFYGICDEKLSGTTLTDICFKGAPGSSNSTFYDNEGKGVGPFIMFYAEMYEHINDVTPNPDKPLTSVEPGESETPGTDVPTTGTGDQVVVEGVTGEVTKTDITTEDKAVLDEKININLYEDYVALDISAELAEGESAAITFPIPAEWADKTDRVIGISIENGELKEIAGTLSEDKSTFTFTVSHFSAKGIALTADTDVSTTNENDGNLEGSVSYVLDTNGVDYGADNKYLIVASGNNYALTADGTNTGRYGVTISSNTIAYNSELETHLWSFIQNSTQTGDNTYNTLITQDEGATWLYHTNSSMYVDNNNDSHRGYWKLEDDNLNSGLYRWADLDNSDWRLYYSGGKFTVTNNTWNNNPYVRLFKRTVAKGDAVTLTVTPASESIYTGETLELTSDVTVAEVAATSSTITWISSDETVATVDENGVVTAVGDGTADITAILSQANGTNMYQNIAVKVSVSVTSRKLDEGFKPVLTGDDSVKTTVNVEPDFSNIKLEVRFDGDTETTFITVENGLKITGYDITKPGYGDAIISYNGKEYGTVFVIVEGNPFEGLESATYYPEYPADGAVRINKTATTNAEEFERSGLTHVELDVAGISIHACVDVVLVADISNSMAWEVATTGTSDADKIAATEEETKWYALKESATSFIDILMEDTDTNTVSFVTFGGYDKERNANSDSYSGYADSVQAHFVGSNDAASAKDIINNISIIGNNNNGTVTYTISGMSGMATDSAVAQGGTNYDYAFLETAAAIKTLKANYKAQTGVDYDNSGRQIYVVFMTDGAPDHYNQLYYKTRSTSQFDYYAQYQVNGEIANYFGSAADLPSFAYGFTQPTENGYYLGNVSNENWITWIQKDSLAAAEAVLAIPRVSAITNVGFDLANGSFGGYTFGEDILEPVLANLAGENSCEVMTTDDPAALKEFYESLAHKIKYAGESAVATDTIGSNFTLQMASVSGTGEDTAKVGTQTVTVTEYTLYTKADVGVKYKTTEDGHQVLVTEDDIGTRTGESTVIETVTFAADGLSATSSIIDSDNIMTIAGDGTITIKATYFTYTKYKDGTEVFKWLIGNITDKEITLGFNVYLKGALEGERPETVYYTNESATLEYIDINGYYATQTFPQPSVYWGGASTTVRFYLVNAEGKPVNRSGEVIPLANCIYIGDPVTIPIILNDDKTITEIQVSAAANLPAEYFLYDVNASYYIQTSSSDGGNTIDGRITPSAPSADASKTTYDDNGNPTTQTGAQTTVVIDAEEKLYTWSIVGFGVRYDLTKEQVDPLVPDQVVIDYGKAINVNVLENNPLTQNFTADLVGFVKYSPNVDVGYVQYTAGSTTLTTDNGTYTLLKQDFGSGVEKNVVHFELARQLSEVEKVFCVVKVTEDENEQNFHYRFDKLEIIPATTVYYETNFVAHAFGTTEPTETTPGWSSLGSASEDNLQQRAIIGEDLYGYDLSYEDDIYYSNGHSYHVNGQGVNETTATFTFTGTGFDIISRTGTKQGIIKVEVIDANGTNVKTVSVLNKSESNLELYQIPVVSINDLTYGTYTVKVHVDKEFVNGTSNTALDVLNRGNEFFFDAVRIYDPIDVTAGASAEKGSDAAIAYAAYVADGEANNEIYEVRQLLIDQNTFVQGKTDGVVFVDRFNGETDIAGADIATYKTIGPNNEVYLTNGQGIAFNITLGEPIPSSIHIGAKTVNLLPAKLSITTMIDDNEGNVINVVKDVKSATSQNIDILNGAVLPTGTKKLTVYITNTVSTGVLSITDLKVAYGDAVSNVNIVSDASTLSNVNRMLGYDTESDTGASIYDIISASFTEEKVSYFNYATLNVTTPEAVESLVVNNSDGGIENIIVEKVETINGEKVWTLKFRVVAIGTRTYTVTGYGSNGLSGASKDATIKVTIF